MRGTSHDRHSGCPSPQRDSLTWGSHRKAQMRPERRHPPAFWGQPQAQAKGIPVSLNGTNLPWMGTQQRGQQPDLKEESNGYIRFAWCCIHTRVFCTYIFQASGTQQGSICPHGKQLIESRNRVCVISVSISNPQPAVLLLVEDWAKHRPMDSYIDT